MKVLMFSEPVPPHNPGGAGKLAWDIFTELSSMGLCIDLITTAPLPVAVSHYYDSRVFTIHHGGIGKNTQSLTVLNECAIVAAQTLIANNAYDVIYDCGGFLYFEAIQSLTIATGLPAITHLLINLPLYLKEVGATEEVIRLFADLQSAQCRASSEVIVTSTFEQLVYKRLNVHPAKPPLLCWNAISDRKVNPEEVLNFRNSIASGDNILLLCGGRLGDKVKSLDRALSLTRALRQSGLGVRLLVTSLDTIEAAEFDMSEYVLPLGRVPDDELPKLYSSVDAFIAPSRYEAFGLMALELACHRSFVIASATGGHLDIAKFFPLYLMNESEWQDPSACLLEQLTTAHASWSPDRGVTIPDVFTIRSCAEVLLKSFARCSV